MKANPIGFHTRLTPELHIQILEAIPKVIIPSRVAGLVKIPQQTLSDWLRRGENDAQSCIPSIFAQLAMDFKYEQALIVANILKTLKSCPSNQRALIWILERCFREDFGSNAAQIQELITNIQLITKHQNMALAFKSGLST